MKEIFMALTLIIFSFIVGCNSKKYTGDLLTQAQKVLENDPDSALILLDSIKIYFPFSSKDLATWCLLASEAKDKLNEEMLPDSIWEKAIPYIQHHGNPTQQAQAMLYLGRSYFEDEEYDLALKNYLLALDQARDIKDYNLAGYICTYIADVYDSQDITEETKQKYEEAIRYFTLAGNERSKAIALTNLSFNYLLHEHYDKALLYCQQADSIAKNLNDSIILFKIANQQGLIYSKNNNLDLAEKSILQAIEYNTNEDTSPNYAALTELYINQNNLSEAQKYLNLYENNYVSEDGKGVIFYKKFLLEKKKNNWKEALEFHEKYQAFVDSLEKQKDNERLVKIEKKYQYQKYQNENRRLNIIYLRLVISLILALVFCLLLVIIFLNSHRQKLSIQQKLDNNKILLLNKELELQKKITELEHSLSKLEKEKEQLRREQKKDEIQYREHLQEEQKMEIFLLRSQLHEMRQQILRTTSIGKKLIKLSQKVVISQTKPLITDKDWKVFQKEVETIYGNYTERLKLFAPSLTFDDLNFCCLSLLGIDTKGMAILLNINSDSVNKKRFRIKERAQLKRGEDNFETFIRNI